VDNYICFWVPFALRLVTRMTLLDIINDTQRHRNPDAFSTI